LIAHLDPFARVVVTALGLGIVEAAALAVLVAAVARVVHASATTRHVLWWIAFACAALLPVASIAMSFHRIEHVRPPAAAAVAMGVPAAPATYGGALSKAPPQPALPPVDATARDAGMTVGAPDGFALLTGAAHTIGHVRGLASALVAFWLAVAFLRIGMLVPGLFWLIRVKREALPLDESVVRRLRRYRHGSRTGRSATILLSAAVDVPIAVGLGAPAILLPVRIAETESIADLDQIVMHEHAHLNRYDDVTNLIQRVIERLFWFNPAIAYAGTRIALEREIACDDAVVAQTGRAHRYATCLWKLVESARLPAQPVMAPGALFTPKQITRRIEQLLDANRNALPRLSPTSALALGALAATLVIVAMQRAPVVALEDPVAPSAPAAHAQPSTPPAATAASATPAVADAAALGTSLGLDIAKSVSEHLAPASAWPKIEREISRANERTQQALAMSARGMHAATFAALEEQGTHRNLSPFHRVEMDGSNDVIVRRGSTPSVDFQGDSVLASHTDTFVEHGSLRIEQNGNDDGHHKAIIVTSPAVAAVEIDGSANVDVENASGDRFAAVVSGSGNVTAFGTVSTASIALEGSGDADLLGLRATTVSIVSDGSGNVKLNAPDSLTVHVEGSGNVAVRGNPKHVFSHIDGSGSITQI
jgi:beta-lactamase regulating signal transducer with metallopeptidase domain